MSFAIEAALPADVPAIAAILNDAILNSVAAWREAPMTDEEMTAWFETRTRDHAVLVARGADGAVLGYASYGAFRAYSGYRHTVEHSVYARGDVRGQGIGTALLQSLAAIAIERGCGRHEWAVLDWNEPAIRFYKALHAQPMNEWTVFRVTGNALENLAREG